MVFQTKLLYVTFVLIFKVLGKFVSRWNSEMYCPISVSNLCDCDSFLYDKKDDGCGGERSSVI